MDEDLAKRLPVAPPIYNFPDDAGSVHEAERRCASTGSLPGRSQSTSEGQLTAADAGNVDAPDETSD
ncbi:hypothetical protein [Tardiphaga sp. 709]|uniref:hypothetical protein n=1 Tax=Tardiphaga sp. 709 TaxID=3076039 RepID=UPI0028ED5FF6|nr:hypothetical protein [Tardiphaga sp. 709]WNV07145.1 hypothetical protein RSO67_16435 [Tardiphaga sp. 709]